MEEIMISALQHYAYCPRQCALIHIEQVFSENEYTMKGNLSHNQVHKEKNSLTESSSMTLWSDTYGIIGRSDKIEWHKNAPIPVEYKFGRVNKTTKLPDEIQLCAQALCLEEMFQLKIDRGEIFYVSSQKRRLVQFSDALRQKTIETIKSVRELINKGVLPKPVNDHRCDKCSLIEICIPNVLLVGNWKTELLKVTNDGTDA